MATPGPAELVLMAAVARRFYQDGDSKSEIAERTGLSRFKVARLIERALASGLVRIDIDWPGPLDVGRSAALQDRFGLRRALVVKPAAPRPDVERSAVGRAAGQLLAELITSQDVLGLAWGRSLTAMAGTLTRLPGCEVVQLTGALQREDTQASSVDLVRDVARVGGGAAYYYHAPMIVATAELGRALREQPEVARAIARIGSVTKAFVCIGGWQPGASTVIDALPAAEVAGLAAAGVVAEISGVLIDADGAPVRAGVTARMIAIRAAQLAGIPDVTALVYGPEKVVAVRAAVRSGMVHGLVTTSDLAEALLAQEG
jgi:DNA-binding transcriptional regulator LsrR (DeoR family)